MEKLRKGKRVPHARTRCRRRAGEARRDVTHEVETWRGTRVVNKEREEIGVWPDLTVVSLMAINCDWLPLTQTFPPEPIYSTCVILSFCKTHNQSFLFSCRLLSVHLRPEPLHAQRSGEQASGTRRPASRHLLGCAGNQVFGKHLPQLLADEIVFFHSCGSGSGEIVFFHFWWTFETATTSSSSLWTFAGLHCKHLPASTEVHYFKQHTMLTSVNGAAGAFGTGPSSGYNPNRLSFIFSMSVVIFAMFISNMSSDKIAHVHIYATTILCVIFWIKSNIKYV